MATGIPGAPLPTDVCPSALAAGCSCRHGNWPASHGHQPPHTSLNSGEKTVVMETVLRQMGIYPLTQVWTLMGKQLSWKLDGKTVVMATVLRLMGINPLTQVWTLVGKQLSWKLSCIRWASTPSHKSELWWENSCHGNCPASDGHLPANTSLNSGEKTVVMETTVHLRVIETLKQVLII